MSTRSQLWAWLTNLVMACVVVGVAVLQVHHVAVPTLAVAVAGLCAASLNSTFRSIVPKNAGIILNGLPFSHLPPSVQAVVRQVVAQMLAAQTQQEAAQTPTATVTLGTPLPALGATLLGASAASVWQPGQAPPPGATPTAEVHAALDAFLASQAQKTLSALAPPAADPGEPPAEEDTANG